jgi:quercetin dioxygenase-like cupin family protein
MTESDLRRRLSAEGLSAGAWSNGPGDRYAAHEHGYDKALVVAAGAIGFGLQAEDRLVELAVGDRLDLPAGTAHDAVVGPAGVTCLEAHAPAGTLGAVPLKRPAGSW